MAQLSRPYQIGLAAVALLAAAWLLLFQGHGSSPSGSGSSQAPAPAHTAKAHEGTAGQATGHGSASSLGALGHDVEKARGAVATSKRNAGELESKSAQASSPSTSSSSSSSAPASASVTVHAKSTVPSSKASAEKSSSASSRASSGAPRQHTVEQQLAHGRIAVIYFWNPKGSDDKAVHKALGQLPKSLHVAVDVAGPGEVAAFGTITRGVQVYGTPTLLVVNRKGEVTTLTGLQDSYAIAQAIREAKH